MKKWDEKNEKFIQFYLRALRICSPKFFNDELENSFMQLQYPMANIQCAKIEVFKIHKQK